MAEARAQHRPRGLAIEWFESEPGPVCEVLLQHGVWGDGDHGGKW